MENLLLAEHLFDTLDWLEDCREKNPYSEKFLAKLHKKIYRQMSKEAGQFRKTERANAAEPWRIPTLLQEAFDEFQNPLLSNGNGSDTKHAIKLFFRIYEIAPFELGNDLVATCYVNFILRSKMNHPEFNWGRGVLSEEEFNVLFEKALVSARLKNYTQLLDLAQK